MRNESEWVEKFASLALGCIRRPYPYHPAHVVLTAGDARTPRELHPAFYGCFDWHSAVHGHWLLVRVLSQRPTPAAAAPIRAALAENLTRENLAVEAAYFTEPGRGGFERTYGWAWLLKLHEALLKWDDPDAQNWANWLAPLAELIVDRYVDFLPRQAHPIRTGVHPNTAFGLAFALDYAIATGRAEFAGRLRQRGRDYYATDTSAPARWEPSGNEFFSPSLVEADLMRRVMPQVEYSGWLDRFLPNLRAGKPESLLHPVCVTDRMDGQLVHLDGLNLSRAWCMWRIAAALPPEDARRQVLVAGAERHATAGLVGLVSGDYMGHHWLGSFAMQMLDAAEAFARTTG